MRSQTTVPEASRSFDPLEHLAPDSPLFEVLLAHPQGFEAGLRALENPEVFKRELEAAEAMAETPEGRLKREAGESLETRTQRETSRKAFENVGEESRKVFSQASDAQRVEWRKAMDQILNPPAPKPLEERDPASRQSVESILNPPR